MVSKQVFEKILVDDKYQYLLNGYLIDHTGIFEVTLSGVSIPLSPAGAVSLSHADGLACFQSIPGAKMALSKDVSENKAFMDLLSLFVATPFGMGSLQTGPVLQDRVLLRQADTLEEIREFFRSPNWPRITDWQGILEKMEVVISKGIYNGRNPLSDEEVLPALKLLLDVCVSSDIPLQDLLRIEIRQDDGKKPLGERLLSLSLVNDRFEVVSWLKEQGVTIPRDFLLSNVRMNRDERFFLETFSLDGMLTPDMRFSNMSEAREIFEKMIGSRYVQAARVFLAKTKISLDDLVSSFIQNEYQGLNGNALHILGDLGFSYAEIPLRSMSGTRKTMIQLKREHDRAENKTGWSKEHFTVVLPPANKLKTNPIAFPWESRTPDNNTALHLFLSNSRPLGDYFVNAPDFRDLLEKLITTNRIEINQTNNFCETLLHRAMLSDTIDVEQVESLFDLGADPDLKDARGVTPFNLFEMRKTNNGLSTEKEVRLTKAFLESRVLKDKSADEDVNISMGL